MTPAPDRRTAQRLASSRTGIPAYQAEFSLIRGRCLGRRCQSRWGVIRLTLDFRARELERFAHVECAQCGRIWRRCRVVPLRTRRGFQTVAVTGILPARANRWFSRGRWHREGDDGLVVREMTLGDLDEAARAHRGRVANVERILARRKARSEAKSIEASARAQESLARWAAFDAAHADDEAAAAAREASYA